MKAYFAKGKDKPLTFFKDWVEIKVLNQKVKVQLNETTVPLLLALGIIERKEVSDNTIDFQAVKEVKEGKDNNNVNEEEDSLKSVKDVLNKILDIEEDCTKILYELNHAIALLQSQVENNTNLLNQRLSSYPFNPNDYKITCSF